MWPATSDLLPLLARWREGLAAGWLPPAGPAEGLRVLAVLLVGVAVKLMDDVLDREEDAWTGRPNAAARLGPAATAYALAALAAAAALSLRDALLLFWASYAWGMAHGSGTRLPLGLRAWQETALTVALSVAAAGLPDTLAALALVGSVQLVDDWIDLRREQARTSGDDPLGPVPGAGPARNWAARLGPQEALLTGLGLALVAAAWDPLRAVAAWAAAAGAGLAGRGPLVPGRRGRTHPARDPQAGNGAVASGAPPQRGGSPAGPPAGGEGVP
ncbi:hypothetical protein [Thermaerobacter subterraneus]|uniref:Uncharacterized protein n=1 Tax=Thermaerobacter subterraneus DSM 13965 TaxID=867903 RepID=K6PM31_9FIRM|nr:hypothetical protein [Thermaerobacter subterraneus]EKP93927.1 hypothetical protein ThesuDRAFT_00172 [Thermaerobacter subterraneus DSM 13965]